MQNCPVCGAELTATLCPACGFDKSIYYEQFPTLSPIPEAKAVSGLQLLREDAVSCPECGKFAFTLVKSSRVLKCLNCGGILSDWAPAEAHVPGNPLPAIPLEAPLCRDLPVSDLLNLPHQVLAIQPGLEHTVILRPDGSVLAVRDNRHGQCDTEKWKNITAIAAAPALTLGLRKDGTVVQAGSEFGAIREWKDICAIAASKQHCAGLRRDGTVLIAENNFFNIFDSVAQWKDITAIAAGSRHIVGLRADGTVVAAGNNTYGKCNTQAWKDIIAIAAGAHHTVGLRKDGTVAAIGGNYYEQCNTEHWQDIVAIAAGNEHTIGLRRDGTVVVTGLNTNWQCATALWRDVVAISAGDCHTVGFRKNGTVLVAGKYSV